MKIASKLSHSIYYLDETIEGNTLMIICSDSFDTDYPICIGTHNITPEHFMLGDTLYTRVVIELSECEDNPTTRQQFHYNINEQLKYLEVYELEDKDINKFRRYRV